MLLYDTNVGMHTDTEIAVLCSNFEASKNYKKYRQVKTSACLYL
jgi:hypothetical protein